MSKPRHTTGRSQKGMPYVASGSEKGTPPVSTPRRFALTKAQQRMLQACLTHRTVDSRTLGGLLFVAPNTICSHFKTLHEGADVHERFAVVLFALERRLIALPWDYPVLGLMTAPALP